MQEHGRQGRRQRTDSLARCFRVQQSMVPNKIETRGATGGSSLEERQSDPERCQGHCKPLKWILVVSHNHERDKMALIYSSKQLEIWEETASRKRGAESTARMYIGQEVE